MKRILFLALIALLAAGCGSMKGQSSSTSASKVAIVAHRGFWKCEAALDSENSIASLAEAQKAGLWGSECDIHLTKDGVVVVNHNPSFVDKSMLLRDHDYADFGNLHLPNGEGLPTFDSYLDRASKSKGTVLVVELKKQGSKEREDALIEKTMAALKAHKLYDPSRVAFISFSLRACRIIAEKAPEFTNQYLSGDLAPAAVKAYGINGIDYQENVLRAHPKWVREAHDLGMSVNVWTVNKPEAMDEMIALGVDQITTNYPLVLRERLGNREMKNKAK